MIISSTPKGDRIALLHDKRLIEYHLEETETQFSVGDIYLGTVRKLVSGLNAAFIDIGYEKDAFLHYLDLGPNYNSLQQFTKDAIAKRLPNGRLEGFRLEPPIDKHGKIDKALTKNAPILVQVVKEPISTKGPRLSCDISLAGRFLVLVPFGNAINISRKIASKQERQRLQRLVQPLKPDNFGVIIRTVAEGKESEEIENDLKNLLAKWEEGTKALGNAKPREKIIGEMSRATSMMRDILNDNFDSITLESREMYDEVRAYIQEIAPEKERIVKLYQGKSKLFEQYGIEKQLKMLFGRSVSLPGGGYLVIDHTEALHVIDVNSGNKSNSEENQEDTALHVNTEAAREIARQLRLRDMGGIIVVDFIDMRKPEHKKQIFDVMREEMKTDRSKFTVLPLSKFGLMQITRQRVRPEMNIQTQEVCPTCGGTGKITASIAVADVIEHNVEYLLGTQNEKGVGLTLHPYLYAFFAKGLPSRRVKWWWKFKTWVNLVQDSSLGVTEFYFHNKLGEPIELQG